jgi:hypothetical protein
MEILLIITLLAAMSLAATLALFYSCYKLDQIIYEREIKSLRDEFDFTVVKEK